MRSSSTNRSAFFPARRNEMSPIVAIATVSYLDVIIHAGSVRQYVGTAAGYSYTDEELCNYTHVCNDVRQASSQRVNLSIHTHEEIDAILRCWLAARGSRRSVCTCSNLALV